ncbi:UbiA family prenyltransferase, partial [Acidobacteriota bacterium]
MQKEKISFSGLVRADNWLYSKIPPLLAVGYGIILVNKIEFPLGFPSLFFLLISICSVAAYGHIVNDISDTHEDRVRGKINFAARLSPIKRLAICLFFIISGFSPFFFYDFGLTAIILLLINYLLPTLYSVPLIRLKERNRIGIVADALGAHAIPTLFLALAMIYVKPGSGNLGFFVAASAGIWAFFLGLRGIIFHQLLDRRFDKDAKVRT